MEFLQWFENSFDNGELFFYLIPFFLFIVLLIVIFIPDSKTKKAGTAQQKKKDHGKASKVETIDLSKGRGAFTTKEIAPEKDKEREPLKTMDLTKGAQGDFKQPVDVPLPKTLEEGLLKTKSGFMSRLKNIFSSSSVTPELIEEMEEILYTADMGVKTVAWLLEEVEKNRKSFQSGEDVKLFLKSKILEVLKSVNKDLPELTQAPTVYLMVGINGAGKTTTIGKFAHKYGKEGKSIVVAAADTFRAAAVEQIKIWGERTGATVVSDKDGADPASVAYNAIMSAKSKNSDLVIVDTAGRLQNRVNLMQELAKINRVIGKTLEGAPHETILVIDSNNGQNALSQAKDFGESVNVSGIIVTKLDGSAKGGVLIGIARELSLPVYMIGIGETVEDLKIFDPEQFVEALFS
jgi:fused signal recognition particle receptor